MKKTYHIKIQGIREPVLLTYDEFQFLMRMLAERRSEHLFHLGAHHVRVGEQFKKVDLDD